MWWGGAGKVNIKNLPGLMGDGGGEGGSGVEPCYSKITTVIASNKRVRWCSRLAVKQLSPDRKTVLVTK